MSESEKRGWVNNSHRHKHASKGPLESSEVSYKGYTLKIIYNEDGSERCYVLKGRNMNTPFSAVRIIGDKARLESGSRGNSMYHADNTSTKATITDKGLIRFLRRNCTTIE